MMYNTITFKRIHNLRAKDNRTVDRLRVAVQFFLKNNDFDEVCNGEAIHYLKTCIDKFTELTGFPPSETVSAGRCCNSEYCWVRTLASYESMDIPPCFDQH